MTDRERGEELHITPERHTPERGVAGGMATAVPWQATAIDRIRWSAIWAGLLVAIATQMILSSFGLAIGLYGVTARAAGAAGVDWNAVALWSAIWGFIALFLGGYVAARLAAAPTAMSGAWHGVVVWALALVLGTLLTSLGITGVLGLVTGTPSLAAADIVSTSWGFFIGALVGLAAAAGGGALGRQPMVEETTDRPVVT